MINGYGCLGNLDESQELFDQRPFKNVLSWNSLLALCDTSKEGSQSSTRKKQNVEKRRKAYDAQSGNSRSFFFSHLTKGFVIQQGQGLAQAVVL